ncbi:MULTISPECIES: hypothetical protein [Clostridium]|uniref:hypothetical protein n=1 Tax=Clostridium TaxID=1485 RepID=UPI0008259B55|nr:MULTISPECIES: hypothetical protein [Clostridium]PJI07670.1 hypothetical protein CUB90_07240 [Clostridium sp. CT7]
METPSIHERLFNYYKKKQSIEMQKEIKSYTAIDMEHTRVAIKVTFKDNNWLRVYQKTNGIVEWY